MSTHYKKGFLMFRWELQTGREEDEISDWILKFGNDDVFHVAAHPRRDGYYVYGSIREFNIPLLNTVGTPVDEVFQAVEVVQKHIRLHLSEQYNLKFDGAALMNAGVYS